MKTDELDKAKERIKHLERELLLYEIENAYLKELNKLCFKSKNESHRTAIIVHMLREHYHLSDILCVVHIPKSTYMYWEHRLGREDPDRDIKQMILDIHNKNTSFGYRRICAALRADGILINKKKVQRLVRELGIQVTTFTRKYRRYNSYKGTVGRIAPNRVRRRFTSCIPHQKITTDTTEFKYYELDRKGRIQIKKLYLDPFMDMYNREIISYSISRSPSALSILKAEQMAIDVTEDCIYRRTFHSDRGWAYQMKLYIKKLRDNHIFQSMSRKGNCLDNGVMENFFAIMKQEMYYGVTYYSYDELKQSIEKYINYYNNYRIKESLGYKSPVQYRLENEKGQAYSLSQND